MYLGIDIGGTTIKGGLVNSDFKIVKKEVTDTLPKEKEDIIVENLLDFTKKLIDSSDEKIEYIGIGCPGNIDDKRGFVRGIDNINMGPINLVEIFENKFNIKTYLSNDANCAALGESYMGASKEYDNSAMVTIGTGIGGGIIINNRLYTGYKGRAGEFGQMTIKFDAPKNRFGRIGIFEDFASMTALVKQAKEKIEENPNSLLAKEVKKNNEINGKIIFDAEDMGCPVAKEIIDRYIFYLSVGIKNIIMSIRPDIVVIGGGISKQKEKLIEKLSKHIDGEYLDSKVTYARLGNDAGIIGASALGL